MVAQLLDAKADPALTNKGATLLVATSCVLCAFFPLWRCDLMTRRTRVTSRGEKWLCQVRRANTSMLSVGDITLKQSTESPILSPFLHDLALLSVEMRPRDVWV